MISRLKLGLAVSSLSLAWAGAAMAQGVPYGAPKEAFIEALADMRPVQLVMQSSGSPGEAQSVPFESYAAALEEWSGGKIEVEVAYGGAIITGNHAPALADGRVSFGIVVPIYDPSNMPVSADIADLAIVSDPRSFYGLLHSFGIMVEVGNSVEEAWREQRAYGVEPGLIAFGALPSAIGCREPRQTLADFAGLQVRGAGAMNARQIEAIGSASVSMPFPEMFEALQRGIVDCALSALSTARIAGTIEVAPFLSVSETETLAVTSSNIGFDAVLWDELPLAARQLLYDLQTIYLENYLHAQYIGQRIALEQVRNFGGEIVIVDDAVSTALADINEVLIDQFRSYPRLDNSDEVTERFIAAAERWHSILDELGYAELDPGWEDFADWYTRDSVDLGPFVERLYEEAMLPYRPSE